jgi:hypothetical protein
MSGLYNFTIAFAWLSFASSFLACCLFFLYERKSRLLLMITLLLISDGLISVNFAIWGLADAALHSDDVLLCRVLLPFQSFFFLLSFGFTSLIAQRFRGVHQLQQGGALPNTPLWLVPLTALVLSLPVVILNIISEKLAVGELIQPNATSDITRDFCYYSSKTSAFIVNVFCLQLPSLITILYNSYAYFTGIQGLNQSAPAIRNKQVRRARKYLIVLLITWVPNLIFNLYHALAISQDNDPYELVMLVVNLSSLQGRHSWVYMDMGIGVYVDMCICVYVYMCIWVYVYICGYMGICVYGYVGICVYVSICVYVDMGICGYVDMGICGYVGMGICIYGYMYMWIWVYGYMRIWVYGYMWICGYVYMCIMLCVYMFYLSMYVLSCVLCV